MADSLSTIKNAFKKNTMLIALIFVMLFFQLVIMMSNKGSLFAPANISNIISQNSYVVVLATGMLLCILTGGNIDLSVGSVVAMVGAVAGTLIPSAHEGVDFALTALFAVLLIDQLKKTRDALPVIVGAAVTIAGIFIVPSQHILLASLAAGIAVLMLLRGKNMKEKTGASA